MAMFNRTGRREFLVGTVGGFAGLGLAAAWPGINRAFAATTLVGVEWGGAYVDAMKQIAEQQADYEILWALHQGGAAAILPKIKAAWPEPEYDFVAAWDPVFQAMLREGWAEAFTLDDVPNLKEVPQSLIYKDQNGRLATIPRSLSGSYWFYRTDTCPIEITTLDDLLDPSLKSQIVFPDPTLSTNMAMVTMALHRGGDERNLEPGWAFVKELAKTGNIGRVAHADIDVNNSISSGETSVSLGPVGVPSQLSAAGIPIRHLTKMPAASGLVTVLYTEGWAVLKGADRKAAFEFLNHCMTPEMNGLLNQLTGQLPTNSKSSVPTGMEHFLFTDAEIKESTYTPDWEYVSEQVSEWMKRWEQEVVPLL